MAAGFDRNHGLDALFNVLARFCCRFAVYGTSPMVDPTVWFTDGGLRRRFTGQLPYCGGALRDTAAAASPALPKKRKDLAAFG